MDRVKLIDNLEKNEIYLFSDILMPNNKIIKVFINRL